MPGGGNTIQSILEGLPKSSIDNSVILCEDDSVGSAVKYCEN